MGMLWYVLLALLFMVVVIVAVPNDDKHTQPPPDPRGVMLQMKQNDVTSPASKAP